MVLQKKPPLLLVLGAALLFLGGGALALWIMARRGNLIKALPAGANAIPDEAVLVLALSTDEAQWRRLRQFGTPTTQAQLDQVLAEWRDRLITSAGINPGTDLQPWVGSEITLALLPAPDATAPAVPGLPPALALESNVVAAIPIDNASAAQEGLGNRMVKAKEIGDNPYRGITLQQLEGDDETPLYAAVLNPELALVSPQVALLKQSIDAFRDGQSLVNQPGFSKAFEQLEETRSLARLYVDVSAAVQTLASTTDPPIPPSRLEALQAPRALVGTLIVANQGLRLQAVSWLGQGPQVFHTGNQADQMTQRLPADTLLMVSTGDFQQFWEDFTTGQQLSALFPIQPEEITLGLQSTTGLVLEEDLLPWLGGEFALGILAPPPAPAPGDALPNPALVLMVKTNDRQAATDTFKRLDEVMANRYRYTVEAAELSGVPVTRWTAPFNSLSLTHGWLEGDVLFFTAGQGVDELVVPKPNGPLASVPLFQATTGSAPRPNNGHFFIDLEGLAAAENSLLLPPLPTAGLLSAEAIEAIGVTATVLSDRQVRYDITAALKRGERPGPLPAAPSPAPTPPAAPTPPSSSPPPENPAPAQ